MSGSGTESRKSDNAGAVVAEIVSAFTEASAAVTACSPTGMVKARVKQRVQINNHMSTFSSDHHQHAQHIRQLRLLATSCFAFTAALALITSWILPLFDQSPQLVTSAPWFLKPVLRWDALHYIHIVQHGYMYEHEWAFFPGLFAVMRIFEKVNTMLGSALTAVLVSTAALFIACDSVVTLYKLSVNLLANPSVALLASQLSLLPSSPVTLWLAPYTEPFFTYLSYRGEP